jgi:hypothetical protein
MRHSEYDRDEDDMDMRYDMRNARRYGMRRRYGRYSY